MEPQVPLEIRVQTKSLKKSQLPEHHVVLAPTPGWAASLTSWLPSGQQEPPAGITTFRNPWPSWVKPNLTQIWNNLQWGKDEPNPYVDLATSHLGDLPADAVLLDPSTSPSFLDRAGWPNSISAQAARLLRIEKPDLVFPQNDSVQAKVTWLGHAGILLQLPSLAADSGHSRPLALLFDPIFSMRCSPSQSFGPIRSYRPPCQVSDLPTIDGVFISHNHFDHLDADTIKAVWAENKDTVRFFVPLGNEKWFVEWGIPNDRVIEFDWWDSATLTHPGSSASLKISCTPCQHSSGRAGTDPDAGLWSGWFLEHQRPGKRPYKMFFAGDSGYQFHESPDWPPSPDQGDETTVDEGQYPVCPAFAEIRDRLGSPQLLLLPVSLGATWSFLRSLTPVPDWLNPVPRYSSGIAAATHMPPWDAVRVMNLMTSKEENPPSKPVAIAIHWGTFVTEPVEVLQTLGQLEWACQKQGVRFARSLPDASPSDAHFVALNHGQSVCT
ncbi:N-acyl-phosphatidylethanolamine-hydrolyzing phospholipase [Echria macrotheca]|uniref:N-acyl-phosphatidylethanolamine-hydrolyzing phospholipase n=1 Tax=Echria macrotheca TaxID=438768 RepID=A0AAJ0B5Y6_9PEZI|nr:N-acyl-phosphatidylethanolamine-hydrolyzing phospholipase [Echria macrotheca]